MNIIEFLTLTFMCTNNTRAEQYYHFCNIPHSGKFGREKVCQTYSCQAFDEKRLNKTAKRLLFVSII